jgi:hypothetical protein
MTVGLCKLSDSECLKDINVTRHDIRRFIINITQGHLNSIIGPRPKQCIGAPTPTQPLTGIKLQIWITLNIYLLYWYFQQNQCLNMLYTTFID